MCPIMRKLALPRAMALSGAGACTIFSHTRQENFGRMCRATLKTTGSMSIVAQAHRRAVLSDKFQDNRDLIRT